MTTSELNAVKFFYGIGIDLTKIPECREKTPDYHLILNDVKVFIEIKEIVENEEEIAIRKESRSYFSPPFGKRFRPKIQDASRQLKKLCAYNQPGIVIIQDLRPWFTTKSPFPDMEIAQAMFGDRELWIQVPTFNSGQKSTIGADLFGKNKTNTEYKNRTISAVGLMIENINTSELILHLFHNPFARSPLQKSFFGSDKVIDYTIDSTQDFRYFVRTS